MGSKLFKWIEKKDLVYWLIIILMVTLLSSNIGQAERLILDNWAFAGTIVSIILAVIAILYTFDQSSTTVASTKKLEDAANRVEEATKGLEDNNVNTMITDLEDRISVLVNEVQQGIDVKLSGHYKEISDFLERINQKNVHFDNSIFKMTKEQWEHYVEVYMGDNMPPHVLVLVHMFYKKKFSLNYSLKEITQWVVETEAIDNTESHLYEFLFFGALSTYKSLGVFDYEESKGSLIVNYFSEELFAVLEQYSKKNNWDEKQTTKRIMAYANKVRE